MSPRQGKVDLTELMNDGVLMAANERFFWPLGLALTWSIDRDLPVEEQVAFDLHVTEWVFDDGHHEGIRPAIAAERTAARCVAAVASYCAACEPESVCRTPECPLRVVSPLPIARRRVA